MKQPTSTEFHSFPPANSNSHFRAATLPLARPCPTRTTTRLRRSSGKRSVSYGGLPLPRRCINALASPDCRKLSQLPDRLERPRPRHERALGAHLGQSPRSFLRCRRSEFPQRKQEKKSYANSTLADSWKAQQVAVKAARKAKKLAKSARIAKRKVIILPPVFVRRDTTYLLASTYRHYGPLHWRSQKIQQRRRIRSPTNRTDSQIRQNRLLARPSPAINSPPLLPLSPSPATTNKSFLLVPRPPKYNNSLHDALPLALLHPPDRRQRSRRNERSRSSRSRTNDRRRRRSQKNDRLLLLPFRANRSSLSVISLQLRKGKAEPRPNRKNRR